MSYGAARQTRDMTKNVGKGHTANIKAKLEARMNEAAQPQASHARPLTGFAFDAIMDEGAVGNQLRPRTGMFGGGNGGGHGGGNGGGYDDGFSDGWGGSNGGGSSGMGGRPMSAYSNASYASDMSGMTGGSRMSGGSGA